MAVDRALYESLAKWRDANTVILGVGNILQGDDGAGPLLCERLSGGLRAVVIDAGTVPENYIQPILRAQPDFLLIVDAVEFGAPVAAIRILEPAQTKRFAFSSHTLSLHLFIERLTTDRPCEMRLIGIQPGSRRLGDAISPPMQAAIESLADTLRSLWKRPA